MITEHKITVNIQIDSQTNSEEFVEKLRSLFNHNTVDFEELDKLLSIKKRPFIVSEMSNRILSNSSLGTMGLIEHTIEIRG